MLTSEPVGPAQLRQALSTDLERKRTQIMVVAPALPASADTGESDPIEAIEDALRTFPADRIVLFTHSESEQRYREDIDPREVERRFGLPVDRAIA